ncbi:winged helix-turn-helix transcriptional regulator [Kibdelosporangium aridum]|uniref:winged helix-turn-helix transcriptional regulator n=1 Tax=Kibdelosporangium aridum TaxID=2030 RepID=UPI0035EF2B4D
MRELLFGPKRFTDLKAGLPTASQNVLSHRLKELEESGILTRRKLGPPAGVWVYELTGRGYDLRPVIIELAKWGCHAPTASAATLSVAALMLAMLTTFSPHTGRRLGRDLRPACVRRALPSGRRQRQDRD